MTFKLTLIASSTAALFIAPIVSAHADDTPVLQKVVVIAHYDNAVGTSDAASQGTVTAELIANRPTLRTAELLELVPGMIVTQHSGDGKANQYFLRGFNLDHGTDFATYVNGMPVNMRSHAHGQGYSDLNFLIPELVKKIDYAKGTYFASEGDFSSAGAARIVLMDRLPLGLASLSLGRYGYQRAVLANSTAAINGNLLYGIEVERNNGPWDTPENVRKYSGTLRYSQGDQRDGFSLTGMAYKNNWNSPDQIPLRAVQSGALSRFGTIDPSDGGTTSRYSLSYAMHQRALGSAFEMSAYAVQSAVDLFSNFTYFQDDPVNGDQFNQSERRRIVGVDMGQSINATICGFDTVNQFGLQTRYDQLSPVGLYTTTARLRTGTVRQDEVKQTSAGLYAENTTQWMPTLRSILGARLDHFHFDVDSSIAGNSGKTHDRLVSPKASLIFGPWDKTEYFVNYGDGFHSNDARGTTQTRLPDGSPADPVTPLVKTQGAEIGLRSEIVPGLQSSLALWRLNIDSELVFVGDAGETEPSRASRRTGIEWNNHYIAAPWLLFDLDLAISRSRYADADLVGDFIPGAIDKVASFGITVTDIGTWSGALNLRYFGSRPLIEDNTVRSNSTTLAYARIGYAIDTKTKLSLDVFNLFNKRASDIDYFYPSQLKTETAPVDDIHFHPVEPRSVRMTVSYRF